MPKVFPSFEQNPLKVHLSFPMPSYSIKRGKDKTPLKEQQEQVPNNHNKQLETSLKEDENQPTPFDAK